MKIIRTANLTIIRTAILGGQIEPMGDYSEGDHGFSDIDNHELLMTDGEFDIEKVKDAIIFNINEYGDNKFRYYGEFYKLKHPKEKNMNILAKRFIEILSARQKEVNSES